MSRFAGLMSSNSDEEESDDPLQMLTPSYTFQQILSSFKPQNISQALPEVLQYENIYSKEILAPECNTFKPPTSDINSPPIQPNSNNNQTKRTQNTQNSNQKRTGKQNARQRQKSGEFNTNIQNLVSSQQLSDEELANSWYYMDPTGFVLGPYPSSLMKQWYDKHLLNPSLLVCQGSKNGVYSTISSLFSDTNHVFENQYDRTIDRIEIQKPIHIEARIRPEKKMTTLFSFSIDEKDDDLLETWEKTEIASFNSK